MTNSLAVRDGGVVGVIKAELEIAKHLKALDPDLGIIRFDGDRLVEVGESELTWLWNAGSVGDAWMAWQRSQRNGIPRQGGLRRVLKPGSTGALGLVYRGARAVRRAFRRVPKRTGPATAIATAAEPPMPFEPDDVVLSYGWMGSGKEREFERIKRTVPITLVYMIYDLAMTRPEIQAFYGRGWVERFEDYVAWASRNCDYLLFGGRTAQDDTRRWQTGHGLPSPTSEWVAHGSEIIAAPSMEVVDGTSVMAKYALRAPFAIAVGSLDPKKNYEILYRAYRIAIAEDMDVPQLLIVGGMHGDRGLANAMLADRELAGWVVIAAPSDIELETLYEAAEFSVLPSMYEGWSLTLPEALAKGKFTLASDVAPLREIGGSLIDYVVPDDPRAWAEAIRRVHADADELARRATAIRREWRPVSWRESAERVLDRLRTWEVEARDARRADLLGAHGVSEPFALVLGRTDDTANPETALRAMLKLWERGGRQLRQLVFAGATGTLSYGYLPRRADDPRLPDGSVVILDKPDAVPLLLERAAIVLVTDPRGAASIAVASAAGRTVIASDSADNRTAEGNVVHVSPFDVYAWADRIAQSLAGWSTEGIE